MMSDEIKNLILAALSTDGAEETAEKVVSPEKKDYSVSARQISNGWIISENWVEETGEGDSCCRDWKSVETYKPTLSL